jgi:protein-disulfide isomerase
MRRPEGLGHECHTIPNIKVTPMKRILTHLPVAVAMLCMALTTAALVRREFLPPKPIPSTPSTAPVANWTEYLAGGKRIGPENAHITILEFADFQCPACRHFAMQVWPAARAKYGDSVALVFRHWPLSYHKHAYVAAIAADCAAVQGSFSTFHDLLFSQQDSIGVKPMQAFAREASVVDLDAFEECALRSAPVGSIEADIRAARSAGGRGTPTLIINGHRYPMQRDSLWLPSLIDSLLQALKMSPRRTS